jgi:hypothetical protein
LLPNKLGKHAKTSFAAETARLDQRLDLPR